VLRENRDIEHACPTASIFLGLPLLGPHEALNDAVMAALAFIKRRQLGVA
jgi:hypothetical protein